MAITKPTNDDLAEIAGRYRLGLDSGDVEAFRQIITIGLASYAAVERMYQASAPEPPDRSYEWPAAAANELGAWYVTTELRGGDGPLAGRRVAIKDNIEVAGLADGLPVGMMIVGRHLADGTCLRVARAFENAIGGFPAPPGY